MAQNPLFYNATIQASVDSVAALLNSGFLKIWGQALAGGHGGGSPVLQIAPVPGGASGLESLFWTWLRNGIRAQGGDPRILNKKVVFQ